MRSIWRVGAVWPPPQQSCVIIRGAGEKAFAAGADISAFARERATVEQARIYGEAMHAALAAIANCRHPTVAMIRGVCVGGGLELACCCDLRLADRSSRFGAPIKQLGSTMAHGEIRALIEVVGKAGALEILLEGAIFGPERALALGLVNRVVAETELEREVAATAARIAEGAPLVARWHKKQAKTGVYRLLIRAQQARSSRRSPLEYPFRWEQAPCLCASCFSARSPSYVLWSDPPLRRRSAMPLVRAPAASPRSPLRHRRRSCRSQASTAAAKRA